MAATSNERAAKRRQAQRSAGLRPVQIWVPDTRLPNFSVQCQLQASRAAQADRRDAELLELMDDILVDVDGLSA